VSIGHGEQTWLTDLHESLQAAAFSFTLEPEVQLAFVHGTIKTLTGYGSSELSNKRLWHQLVLEEDREALERSLSECVGRGGGVVKARLRRRDGHIVKLQARLSLSQGGKSVEGCVWLEEPLGQPVRQVLDELPDPVLVVDRRGTILAANVHVAALGYAPAELIGQPVEMLVPAASRASHVTRRDSYFASPQKRSMGKGPFAVLAATGEQIPADISLGPLRGTDAVIAVLRDLRHVRNLEEHSRAAERRFRATFEQAAVGLAHLATTEFRWLAVNHKLEQITGYTEAELLAMSPLDISIELDREAELRLRDELLAGQREHSVRERQLRRKDGAAVWVRLTTSLARDEAGQPMFFVCVVEDIDGLKKTEELVRKAQRLDSLGRLASGIAHDFNNLLSVILSYGDALVHEDEDQLSPQCRKDAIEIVETARRAAQLTRQLLAFGRRQAANAVAIDSAEFLRSLDGLLRPLLGARINYAWNVAEGTPPCLANISHLEQIIVNLVVNARDAMPEGGSISVEVRSTFVPTRNLDELPSGNYVTLEVRDTGHGIPTDVLPHIFEPFFTTKAVGKGTGLGLATVKALAKQSRGAIEVATSRSGTTFTVSLPAAEDAPAVNTPAPPDAPRPIARGQGQRLLVVDDDDAVRRLLHWALREAGYEVVAAANGAEAVFVASQQGVRFDALVTDVEMPLLDGPDLAAELVARQPDLPVLFVTSHDDAVAGTALARTVSTLRKPFTRDELLAAVSLILHAVPAPAP
jgi:PAS domain S-box-containing protein